MCDARRIQHHTLLENVPVDVWSKEGQPRRDEHYYSYEVYLDHLPLGMT